MKRAFGSPKIGSSNKNSTPPLALYARKGDPAKAEGTYRLVKGTGKFAGVTGGGKYIPIGTFPPPPGTPGMTTGCNHDWGSLTIK
jgi:hypothetical protein